MKEQNRAYCILVAAASSAIDLLDAKQTEKARELLQSALYEAEEEMIRDK